MGYPPAEHLLSILIEDGNEGEAAATAAWAAGISGRFKEAVTIGPADAPVGRIKDIFRKQVYIKCGDYEYLTGIKDCIEESRDKENLYHSHIEFDFDPI